MNKKYSYYETLYYLVRAYKNNIQTLHPFLGSMCIEVLYRWLELHNQARKEKGMEPIILNDIKCCNNFSTIKNNKIITVVYIPFKK